MIGRAIVIEDEIGSTTLFSTNSFLQKRAPASSIGQLLAAIIVAAYIQTNMSGEVQIFLAMLIILNIFRLVISKSFPLSLGRSFLLVYSVPTVLTGFCWGLLASTTLRYSGLESELTIILLDIAGGIAAAAAVTLSASRKLSYSFILATLLPIVGTLLLFDIHPHTTIALVSLAYAGFLIHQAKIQSMTIWNLKARQDNIVSLLKVSRNAIVLHQDGIIIDLNNAFEILFKTNKSDSVGKPLLDYFCKDAVISPLKPNERIGLTAENERFPVSIFDHGIGDQKLFLQATSIYDLRDEQATGLIISNAMSERERLIEKNRSVEEYASSRARFLADMSHEIRTPLNGIIGIADIISENPNSADLTDNVRILKDSADHLYRLINDVLDVSKIDAHKIELHKKPFLLDELIHKQTQLLKVKAAEVKSIFKVEIQSDVHRELSGDQTRLGQILLNLLSNAVKFAPNGVVYLRVLQLKSNEKSVYLKFEIIDTGIGMSCEQIGKLFQAYSQTSSDTFATFGGTGLGLNISQQLAGLMGSRINVESEIGKGSKFFFEIEIEKAPSYQLPAIHLKDVSASGVSAELSPSDREELSKLRVLVAEDNSTNRLVMASILKNLKVEFQFANDGADVFPALEKNDYDLILMDCHMPNLDGFKATKILRERGITNRSGQPMPIIALTASVRAEDRDRCLDIGMNSFIPKPVRAIPLSKTILGLLRDLS